MRASLAMVAHAPLAAATQLALRGPFKAAAEVPHRRREDGVFHLIYFRPPTPLQPRRFQSRQHEQGL